MFRLRFKNMIIVLISLLSISVLIIFFVIRRDRAYGNRGINAKAEPILDPEENMDIEPGYQMKRIGEIEKDGNGNIYILDTGRYNILVYSSNMEFLREIGRVGQGPGEFINPVDFCLDNQDNIYVLDYGKEAVTIFDKNGKYKDQVLPHRFFLRGSIAVDSEGLIYIACAKGLDSLITVFNQSGKKVNAFGSRIKYHLYNVEMNLNEVSIDFDQNDNLWVVFHNKPLIRRYTKDGKLILEKKIEDSEMISIEKDNKIPKVKGDRYSYSNFFTDIYVENSNMVFVGGNCYVYKLDSLANVVKKYKYYPVRPGAVGDNFIYSKENKSIILVTGYMAIVFKVPI